MIKTIFILLIGLAVGYSYGFSDAKKNDRTIFARTVGKVGGSTRGKVGNDLDARMDSLDKRR
ncbi:MAG: hypothetical protein ACJ8AO_15040 [Gemmatimonadaceae bacterium]|jgi:hypothetical protein